MINELYISEVFDDAINNSIFCRIIGLDKTGKFTKIHIFCASTVEEQNIIAPHNHPIIQLIEEYLLDEDWGETADYVIKIRLWPDKKKFTVEPIWMVKR